MVLVEASLDDMNRCEHLFRLVGFAHLRTENRDSYETHLRSNRKILSMHGEVLLEIGQLLFYDDAVDHTELEPGTVLDKRRFRWTARPIQVPPTLTLTDRLFDALSSDGFFEGYPLGFFCDEPKRVSQVRSIGSVTEDGFSEIVRLEKGEIHIYPIPKDVPEYPPGLWQRRN